MKIDFSKVGKRSTVKSLHDGTRSGLQMRLSEPVWVTGIGEVIPLSELAAEHLQRIERWLRGGGATVPPDGMYNAWYRIIALEMGRRNLPMLTDHPEAYKRHPAQRVPEPKGPFYHRTTKINFQNIQGDPYISKRVWEETTELMSQKFERRIQEEIERQLYPEGE